MLKKITDFYDIFAMGKAFLNIMQNPKVIKRMIILTR